MMRYKTRVISSTTINSQCMKKLLLMLFVATAINTVSAASIQADTIPDLTKQQFQLKGKRQLTGAIVFLTGGTILSVAGAAMVVTGATVGTAEIIVSPITGEGVSEETNRSINTGTALLLVGVAAALTSIPLFISSGKNKKKALTLSAYNQVIQQMQKNSISRVSVPSIKLSIDL